MYAHGPIIPGLGSGRKEIECGAGVKRGVGIARVGEGREKVVCVGFGSGYFARWEQGVEQDIALGRRNEGRWACGGRGGWKCS
jgi:hypothetical protein